jgi:hypothetical protein
VYYERVFWWDMSNVSSLLQSSGFKTANWKTKTKKARSLISKLQVETYTVPFG